MLITAIVLFAIAAAGGAVLALRRLGDKPMPMPLALAHGAAAAAALTFLLIGGASAGFGGALAGALGLFVVAALGGFALFGMHLRGKTQPVWLVGVHGVVAVVAFGILLYAVLA